MNILRALVVLLFLGSCNTKTTNHFDLIITNATIIDVLGNTLTKSQLIAISQDTIRMVDDMTNLNKYKASQTYDAANKFVMPGLWDNHVHFRGGDTLIEENKKLLPLFLAYGITNIRDAGGDITPSVLKWKNQINNKKLAGPTIFTSGPKLDGNKPAWPGSIIVDSNDDVKIALDSLELLNVDYVKMYDGSLKKEIFYEIIKQAEARGLKTTGHMPLSADILTATTLGLDGTEHMYYVIKSCSPLVDSLTQTNPSYSMFPQIVESYDPKLADSVLKKLASQNAFITPTLYIGKVLSELTEVDHKEDSLLNYIDKGIQKTYQGRIETAKKAKSQGNSSRSQLGQLATDMIVPLYKSGVKVLAGSDSGAFNSFVYPGESLHLELQSLVAAGLTPQQALITSMINGPEFFGLREFYGSIAEHKVANLVILERNPLENIKNLDNIKATIIKGKVYDKKMLDNLLQELKK
ncbi:amidohydrolase family protein [Gillisia sp. CAL575]|uniref:amidohydrolase family protein n=1 Tax=Gillisia sp. CAL575 TaxID=985255 RepID=UPI0003A648C0|nr:amidohydrolase family protein [Gillisia sp. CAL575]